MGGLLFLSLRQTKNRIFQMFKKPARLVLTLLIVAFLTFNLFLVISQPQTAGTQRMDLGWFQFFFLLYLLFFGASIMQSSLAGGTTLFEMADVNFMFVAPMSPKKILVYGVMKSGGRAMLSSIFILFMGSTLQSNWGIGPFGLLLTYLAFIAVILIMQTFGVVLYMFASRNPVVKKVVPVVGVAILAPLIGSILWASLQRQPLSVAVLQAVEGPAVSIIPVLGWTVRWLVAFLTGSYTKGLVYLLATVAFFGVMLLVLLVGKADYYEDVLVATERVFARKQAVAEGNIDGAAPGRKIRVRKEEIWGQGARVFLGKHLLEMRRKNRLFLLDSSSISLLVTALIMSFLQRDLQNLFGIFAVAMLMHTLLIGTGLGLRELYSPYIFLVPASSFSKIVWSNLEVVVKGFVENLLLFTIAGLVMKAPIWDIVGCTLAASVFVVLLVSVNLLSIRIFADVINQGLTMILYFLFILLIMVPGVVLGILLVLWMQSATSLPFFLLLTGWQLLISLLLFYLSKGVLDTCDMQTMPRSTRG